MAMLDRISEEMYAEAWYGLGCCYDALERFKEALTYFRRAVEINPDSSEFWYAKADCEYNAGILDVRNLSVQAGGIIEVEFDITLGSTLPMNYLVPYYFYPKILWSYLSI